MVTPPWPLSAVFDGTNPTRIVIADVNYGMLRIISQQQGSLEEYLRLDMQQRMTPAHVSEREARIISYIADSSLTSYADVVVNTPLGGCPWHWAKTFSASRPLFACVTSKMEIMYSSAVQAPTPWYFSIKIS